ncbi:MAG: type II CRISPR-associated endonuclease Cas1 [Spirochaetia bacterium]
MFPHVVEVQKRGAFLHKDKGFLVIQRGEEILGRVDLDHFQTLLISSPSCTLTTPLMQELAQRGIIIVLCDARYLPVSVVTPWYNHISSMEYTLLQTGQHATTKKKIWQHIVRQKILHQGQVLQVFDQKNGKILMGMSKTVEMGDPVNKEAQAARLYFQALFGQKFRRGNEKDVYNHALNYGYTLLRSAMIRAIVVAGLHPSLPIMHSGERNPYCLADDLMEPYRPLVDLVIKSYLMQMTVLGSVEKKRLSKILSIEVSFPGRDCYTTVSQSMQYMAYSFLQVLQKKKKVLDFVKLERDVSKWLKNAMDT